MHSFSDNHLVVMDPFGLTRLTRVTLPNKVKTNKKVNGEFVVANGKLLIGHSNVGNQGFAMTVPELKVISVAKVWYSASWAVTPAGLPIESEYEGVTK